MKTKLLFLFLLMVFIGLEYDLHGASRASECTYYAKEAQKYQRQSKLQRNHQMSNRFEIISLRYQYQYIECLKYEARKKAYKGYR